MFDPAVIPLGITPGAKTLLRKDICTPMFIEILVHKSQIPETIRV